MQAREERFLVGLAIVLAVGTVVPAAAVGAQAKPAVTVRAFAGKPFGVGMITLSLPPVKSGGFGRNRSEYTSAFSLTSKDARAMYPVFESLPRGGNNLYWLKAKRPQGQPAGLDVPKNGIVAYFLFKGSGAFDVTLIDATSGQEKVHTARVVPAAKAELHGTLLDTYWWAMQNFVQGTVWADTHLPVAENYVLAMLSRRLNRTMPQLRSSWMGEDLNLLLGIIVGAESVKLAMQRKALLRGAEAVEKPDQPLPKPLLPALVKIPRVKGRVPIEPMAMHVPVECFYIRFGSFKNFQWMRRFLDTWGTMIRDLTASRSTDYEIAPRLEKQLILAETALARLLGNRLISDVAIVGSDAFVREGASLGIIFEARSTMMLSAQFAGKRAAAVKADPSVTEKTVIIAGRKVSLVSSPDNTVRSFYAVDGNYHLVATSRTLVRRFFEAGAGKDSLGKSLEFRWGRRKMPLSRDDTLFVYLSDPFFRNMVSPAYRVEMTRRMRSLSKMQLIYLAQLAARSEGKKGESIKDLIAGDFLPAGFQKEPDGSTISLVNGRPVDSLRGVAGTLLPTWDVEIKAVTPSEAKAYKIFTNAYRNEWEQMDPAVIGFRHVPKTEAGNERVVMDLVLTPYARKHYRNMERELGKAIKTRIAPVPDDLVSIEVNLKSSDKDKGLAAPGDGRADDLIGKAVNKMLDRPQRLFAGLQDCVLPFAISHGYVRMSHEQKQIAALRVYAGETPDVQLLRWLGGNVFRDKKPDKDGYYNSGNADGTGWRRAWNNFYVMSTNRKTLEQVTAQLKIVPAKRPAQIRVNVKSLREAKFAPLLTASAYVHVRKASAGNAIMLRSVSRLMNAGPEQTMATVRRVLGARLVCPLGGTYRPSKGKSGIWVSSAWRERTVEEITRIPDDFRFAPLQWFRGLVLEFAIDPQAQTLSTHIELDTAPEKGDR